MSRLGGLGIQSFTNLSQSAAQTLSNAFNRTLQNQQFNVQIDEQRRRDAAQRQYAEEQQAKAEKKATQDMLVGAGIGIAGGALTGGALAALAPAGTAAGAGGAAAAGTAAAEGLGTAGLGGAAGNIAASAAGAAAAAPTISVGQGALLGGLIGGLGSLPGGQTSANLLATNTPLFNPQLGYNQQQLGLQYANLGLNQARLAATQQYNQSRLDDADLDRAQRLKIASDAEIGRNSRAALVQDRTDARFGRGQENRFALQSNTFNQQDRLANSRNAFTLQRDELNAGRALDLEAARQSNRLGLEGIRQGNRQSLAEYNQGQINTRAALYPRGAITDADRVREYGADSRDIFMSTDMRLEALRKRNELMNGTSGASSLSLSEAGPQNFSAVQQKAMGAASPEEARAIIENSALSPEQKRRLLGGLGG